MGSKDEDSIYKELDDFVVAWNKGDAKGAASFYTLDGTRVGAYGDIRHGRAEVERGYDQLLQQTMKGSSVKQEKGSIRMLTPDLAVWQGAFEMIPPGKLAMKGYVVQVMKKVSGRWLVLEAHPKFFPPNGS